MFAPSSVAVPNRTLGTPMIVSGSPSTSLSFATSVDAAIICVVSSEPAITSAVVTGASLTGVTVIWSVRSTGPAPSSIRTTISSAPL